MIAGRFIYEDGNAEGSPLGLVVVTLDRDVETVQLVHTRGRLVRTWRATLPAETWNHLVEILGRAGFPKQPVMLRAPLPGDVTTKLSLEHEGNVKSVTYRGDTDDYVDVGRVVWNIVAQMTPSIVGGPDDVPTFPKTRIEDPREVV